MTSAKPGWIPSNPAFRPPQEPQFLYLRILHSDQVERDWPYLWFTDAELAAMTEAEIAAAKTKRDQSLWFWAKDLFEEVVVGPKVSRIIAEWVGPVGSEPPTL